jgi:hypothetical protein
MVKWFAGNEGMVKGIAWGLKIWSRVSLGDECMFRVFAGK